MKRYGLIGYPLTHSFSKRYFSEKFEKEHITDSVYELFPIAQISDFPDLLAQYPDLCGLNVTIPYKEQIIPYLHQLDAKAQRIGAVNVIKIQEKKLIGYNSDYEGFKISLRNFLNKRNIKALILGTGGASKAVKVVLEDLQIPYLLVSRSPKDDILGYEQIDAAILSDYQLIINTTPLGMLPNIDLCPPIAYQFLNENHFLFDLVYNPSTTVFMKKGLEQGSKVINGLEMLYGQAHKAWQIWQE